MELNWGALWRRTARPSPLEINADNDVKHSQMFPENYAEIVKVNKKGECRFKSPPPVFRLTSGQVSA